jgi:AraC family transcriptional regulator
MLSDDKAGTLVADGVVRGAQASDEDAVLRLLHDLLNPMLEGRRCASDRFRRHIVLALQDHLESKYSDGSKVQNGRLAPWQLTRAQEYMVAHIGEDIVLAQVAAECGLSVNHFVRSFRQSTGTTPHRWLMSQRMRVAMQLMKETHLTLAEIASACGFSDQSHLTRVFSERLDMTPGQWRKTCSTANRSNGGKTLARRTVTSNQLVG